ncbi:ATP-binding protein [Nocardioides ochotonae]|uniref:ATP-binding protein n=1 Tax=Nocardioides ochotonae TaxID=2685869 RepID=UPI00140A99FC|nr:ATP-binding protein [Nocardioides ochotonae]
MTTSLTPPAGSLREPSAEAIGLTSGNNAAKRTTLPVPPSRYVPTADVNAVRFALRTTIRTGHISLIDGPRGVGKTTAIVEAVRLHKTAHPIYANLIDTRTPRDAMRQIWEAATGEPAAPRATAADIRDDLTSEIRHRDAVLVTDDVHNLTVPAMRIILALWNRTHDATGKGLPTILVGNGLAKKVGATVPELVSRAAVTVNVGKMPDKDLMAFLLRLEPGIEGTNPRVFQDVNRLHLKGRIRKWIQFFDLIKDLRNQQTLNGPIDSLEVRHTIAFMPVIDEKNDN